MTLLKLRRTPLRRFIHLAWILWLLHPKRFVEWLQVMAMQGEKATPSEMAGLIWRMAKVVLKSPFTKSLLTWRQKYRKCRRCPIFERNTRSCYFLYDAELYGCGCYMPYKAFFSKNGWATETKSEIAEDNYCW